MPVLTEAVDVCWPVGYCSLETSKAGADRGGSSVLASRLLLARDVRRPMPVLTEAVVVCWPVGYCSLETSNAGAGRGGSRVLTSRLLLAGDVQCQC